MAGERVVSALGGVGLAGEGWYRQEKGWYRQKLEYRQEKE